MAVAMGGRVRQMTATSAIQWALTGATVGPWALLLVAHHLGVQAHSWLAVAPFGVMHVGATAAFYFDPELAQIRRANRGRYLWAPVALVLSGAAVVTVSPRPIVVVGVGLVTVWQIHHFTRQNLGCLSFMAKARGAAGPSLADRRTLDITTVAGVCGVVVTIAPYGERIPGVDVFAFVGLVALAVAAGRVVLTPAEGWRRAAMAVAVCFYAPLFLYRGSITMAVAAYSFAHGAQYLVMMSHLPRGRSRSSRRRMAAAVIAGVVVVGGLLRFATGVSIDGGSRWIVGAYLGAVFSHFVIDAGIWKMRDPGQRAYWAMRFPFLSSRQA